MLAFLHSITHGIEELGGRVRAEGDGSLGEALALVLTHQIAAADGPFAGRAPDHRDRHGYIHGFVRRFAYLGQFFILKNHPDILRFQCCSPTAPIIRTRTRLAMQQDEMAMTLAKPIPGRALPNHAMDGVRFEAPRGQLQDMLNFLSLIRFLKI